MIICLDSSAKKAKPKKQYSTITDSRDGFYPLVSSGGHRSKLIPPQITIRKNGSNFDVLSKKYGGRILGSDYGSAEGSVETKTFKQTLNSDTRNMNTLKLNLFK